MKNYTQRGDIVDFAAPSGGCTSGVPFLVGVILAVPQKSEAVGVKVACLVNGVCELPKATGVTPAAGGIAYWDDTAKKITSTVGSNTAVGWFTMAALTGDTTAWVKLDR